jgi:hypothetical protein
MSVRELAGAMGAIPWARHSVSIDATKAERNPLVGDAGWAPATKGCRHKALPT